MILSLLLVACVHPGRTQVFHPSVPYPVSSLEAEGLQSAPFVELEQRFATGPSPDGLVVLRNGKVVYEFYGHGFDREDLHDLRSATKSVTSLLVGIAVEQGADPGAALADSFPEIPFDPRLTPADLLAMRSGLDCDDWDPSSPGQEDRMYRKNDWVRHTLALPQKDAPNSVTRYCTGGVVVLGAWLERSTHTAVPEFASENLFDPLGIRSWSWANTPEGGTDTGGHLMLRPLDFARIGQLVSDRGTIDGHRLVPEVWIDATTSGKNTLGDSRYGDLWWSNTFTVRGTPIEVVFARGNGGQMLFIAPSLQLVAAFTGGFYNRPEADLPIEWFGRYIAVSALP